MAQRVGRERWLWAAGAALLQMLVLLPLLGVYLGNLEDEGFIAGHASRVAAGQVPYRDYFTRFMPGTDWTLGLAFRLFGESLPVLRGYFVIMSGLLAGAVQLFSCRLLPRGWSELPALFFICLGVQAFPLASFHWDANLLTLIALCLIPHRPLLAGLFCGLTVIVLQTKGVAACLGLGLAALASRRYLDFGRLVAGAAIPGLAFVAWLVGLGIFGLFWKLAVAFNAGAYASAQTVPYDLAPLLDELRVLADGLARFGSGGIVAWSWWFLRALAFTAVDWIKYGGYYPVVLVGLVLAYRRRNPVFLALVLVLLVASGLDMVRPNRYRLNLQSPLWNVVLVYALYHLPRARKWITGAVVAAYVVHGFDNVTGWLSYRYPVRFPRGVLYAPTPQAAAVANRVVYDVLPHSPPGSPFFAFPDAPFYMWLMDRPNPTRLEEAIPLFYPEEELERATRDLAGTPCILYVPIANLADYPRLDPRRFAEAQERLRARYAEGFLPASSTPAYTVYRR